MKENKKQHYVPQFYLKLFSQDGKHLCGYNLKSKASFQGSIKNLCQSKYFYGQELRPEKILGKIEQEQAKALRKLITTLNLEILTHEDYFNVLLFVLLQYTRTEYAKIVSNKMVEQLVSKFLKPMMKCNEELKGKGITEENIDCLKITFPEAYKIGMLTALAGAELISDLKLILILNKSNRNFICSDAPIALYNYKKIKGRCMTGFQSPGLQIFCPLNKDLVLLLIDTNLYNLKINTQSTIHLNNDSDVDSINKLQFFNCLHNVFFSDKKDESYVKKLHDEVKELIKEKEVKLDTVHKTQFNEIFRTYVAGSNHTLKLSFIKLNHTNNRHFKFKYKKLSKSSEVFHLCRNKDIVDRVESRCEKAMKKAKKLWRINKKSTTDSNHG